MVYNPQITEQKQNPSILSKQCHHPIWPLVWPWNCSKVSTPLCLGLWGPVPLTFDLHKKHTTKWKLGRVLSRTETKNWSISDVNITLVLLRLPHARHHSLLCWMLAHYWILNLQRNSNKLSLPSLPLINLFCGRHPSNRMTERPSVSRAEACYYKTSRANKSKRL